MAERFNIRLQTPDSDKHRRGHNYQEDASLNNEGRTPARHSKKSSPVAVTRRQRRLDEDNPVAVTRRQRRLDEGNPAAVTRRQRRLDEGNPAAMTRRQKRLDDEAYAVRQLSGLLALTAMAEPETIAVPFSGTSVSMRYTGPIERLDETLLQPRGTSAAGGGARRLAFLRGDQMLRNSLYLIINSGSQAVLGFVFWIIAARLFSTADVGLAGSLMAATGLIEFLGLLGMNTTFIRYLPIARDRNRLMTAGVVLVAICSGFMALVYVFLIPEFSPSISFVTHSLPLAVGFVLLTVGGGINMLTDSVFIAVGKAGYNAVVDGLVGGIVKIVLIVSLVGAGSFGIFSSAIGGFVVAAVVSLLLMVRVVRWRPDFHGLWLVIKPVLRFSGMNYVANVLNLIPSLVVPLMVLNRIGPSGAAFYYVSFQLASVIYTAAGAVEQAFLAEGSKSGAVGRRVLMRSLRILMAFCIPAFIFMLVFGHVMLLAFGTKYVHNAAGPLIPLSAAVLPIAANNWFLTVLRLANQLKAIVISNAIYAAAIIGLAWFLAPQGLTVMSLCWPIGAATGALAAGVAAAGAIRRNFARRR